MSLAVWAHSATAIPASSVAITSALLFMTASPEARFLKGLPR
jgi:hypothetical protein